MPLGHEQGGVQRPLNRYAVKAGSEHSSPAVSLWRDQAGAVCREGLHLEIFQRTEVHCAPVSAYFHEKYPGLKLPDLRVMGGDIHEASGQSSRSDNINHGGHRSRTLPPGTGVLDKVFRGEL